MIAICIAFTLALVQPEPSASVVPMREEPYHRSVLENGDVAVYDVRLPVGAVMKYHAHPTNHLAIVIEPGLLRNEVLGRPGQPNPTGAAGNIVYLGAGPPHRQTNIDRAPIRFIAVELLRPVSRDAQTRETKGMREGIMGPEQRVAPDGAPGCHVAIDASDVRVWRCRLAPGETASRPGNGSFLRIAVTAGTTEQPEASGASRRARVEAGAVAWHTSASAMPARNAGDAPSELVDIEYKQGQR